MIGDLAGHLSVKRTDTGGEFRVGSLFMGVGGWRVCFCVRSWPFGGPPLPGAGPAGEFATSVRTIDGHNEIILMLWEAGSDAILASVHNFIG